MLKSPLITSTGSSSVKSFHLSSSKISNFISPSFFSSFLNLQKFSGSSFLNHLNSVIQLNLDDPTISNQDFIGNTLFLEDHTKIVSCVFANNTSPTSGGAISVRRYNCSIEIHNSDFSLNNAFIGGAVYISSFTGNLVVSESTFSKNSATSGSDVFFHGNIFDLSDVLVEFSIGQTSFVFHETNYIRIDYLKYYRNEGEIQSISNPVQYYILNSCFTPIPNSNNLNFFDIKNSEIIFMNCCFNFTLVKLASISNLIEYSSLFNTFIPDFVCEYCEIIKPTPTPTQSLNVKFGEESVSYIVLIFLIIIALGCIVTCFHDLCVSPPEQDHKGDVQPTLNP